MNPINKAFGPYGNIIGISKAGIEPLANLSAIPLNDGIISPKIILTPVKSIIIPAAKVIP